MIVLKCKMCGGDIQITENKAFGICDSCGSATTLPSVSDERRINLHNRAIHYRQQNEFDKALATYESILAEDANDAEAHWGYEQEAKKIAEIQKGILAVSSREEPYDIFICYKETDSTGRRTIDSTLAQDIFYHMGKEGFKVFFSRISLEDKLGVEYEPYIFAALNSAKVMLVVGTKAEHFNAVWVKNEWLRFAALAKKDCEKAIIPCYRDMDAYDLPDELSIFQSQDMGKIGFIQDLVHGIKKIIGGQVTPKSPQPTSSTATGNYGDPEQIKKIRSLAERARKNNNISEAAKYYEELARYIGTSDWEVIFYKDLYAAMSAIDEANMGTVNTSYASMKDTVTFALNEIEFRYDGAAAVDRANQLIDTYLEAHKRLTWYLFLNQFVISVAHNLMEIAEKIKQSDKFKDSNWKDLYRLVIILFPNHFSKLIIPILGKEEVVLIQRYRVARQKPPKNMDQKKHDKDAKIFLIAGFVCVGLLVLSITLSDNIGLFVFLMLLGQLGAATSFVIWGVKKQMRKQIDAIERGQKYEKFCIKEVQKNAFHARRT